MVNNYFRFREDVEKVKLLGDWKVVYDFYFIIFDFFLELNVVFKVIIYKIYFLFLVLNFLKRI